MSTKKKISLGIALLFLLATVYLLVWPVPIDPAAWEPPEAPALEGVYAPNDALAAAERLGTSSPGPEDVAVDAAGRIYAGLADGRIVRLLPHGGGEKVFVDTGGRPLGLHFDSRGHLIVADSHRGLLDVAPDGEITTLVREHDGLRFGFTDDLDIAPDGTIYFTDASHRWGQHTYREDVFEHRPLGRLLAYDPKTKETRLVKGDLYFANGVAVAADGTFLLVNETTAYRVQKVWLQGPRAGQSEIVVDNLPGFPDGISRGSEGRFWVALFSPRVGMLDAILPSPFLRKVVYRLPQFLQPAPARHGFVLGIDAAGAVVHNLQHAADDSFSPITSVQEHGGMLYLGSLTYPGLARLPVPARPK